MVPVTLMTVAVRASARGPRVLAEYQGFDGDGNGLRGHANASKVDVIEVPETTPSMTRISLSTPISSRRMAPRVCAMSRRP